MVFQGGYLRRTSNWTFSRCLRGTTKGTSEGTSEGTSKGLGKGTCCQAQVRSKSGLVWSGPGLVQFRAQV